MIVPTDEQTPERPRVAEVLAALSLGLDLADGQPMGHSLRACLAGMKLAGRLRLPVSECRDLYFTLLLQNAGAPCTGAGIFASLGGDDRLALRELALVDRGCDAQALRWALRHGPAGRGWSVRAWRAARLLPTGRAHLAELFRERATLAVGAARRLRLGARVIEALAALDERWDGAGLPRGSSGSAIPLIARLATVARALELFAEAAGPRRAVALARERRGRWFEPALVEACGGMEIDLAGWSRLDLAALRLEVREAEPGGAALLAGPVALDRIAATYGELVDAQSPWRVGRSRRVATLAGATAHRLGWSPEAAAELRRAALLHDIGLLAVPARILDSRNPLPPHDWEAIRFHPHHSRMILEPVPGFAGIATAAATHHERLDGRGYFLGLRGAQVPQAARTLAVADIFDALTSSRAFRTALQPDDALALMRRDRGIGLCGDSVEALADAIATGAATAEGPARAA